MTAVYDALYFRKADGSGFAGPLLLDATTQLYLALGGAVVLARQGGHSYTIPVLGSGDAPPLVELPPIAWPDFLANGPAIVLVLNDPGGTVSAPPGSKPLTVAALSAG